MDLVVVPGSLDLVSSSEGPVWVWEGLGLLLRSAICLESAGPGPASGRWAVIAQRAINFTRSRRRVSLTFAHYNSYSLRNTAGSKPTLKRRKQPGWSLPGGSPYC